MSIRDERTASQLMELAAKFIALEAGRSTLITPTRVDVSPDHKNTTIFVSVFPDSDTDNAMAFLARNRDEFRNYLKKAGRFSVLPFIKFEFDYGEKNRQHLDDLSRDIEPR